MEASLQQLNEEHRELLVGTGEATFDTTYLQYLRVT
jgi:hypothetical protein